MSVEIYMDVSKLQTYDNTEPFTWKTFCQICGMDVSGPINSPVYHLCPQCRGRLMRVLYGEDKPC